jgi:dolichyl-phosphate-mannose-protein mannosyltransferase
MTGESSAPWISSREKTLFVGGVTVLLFLGAVLRLHDLGGPAFDCDELYSLRIQGSSLKEVASVIGRSAFHDLHPPLSYLLFMAWIAPFGTGEAAVRSLPLLLGLVAIVLLGLVGRRIGGVWVGLAAAAFLTFNPLHIAYSQEARPYALAVALTIAAHLFFLRSLGEAPAWNRIVYALLAAAGIYTHYFVLFALLPHGLIALGLLLAGDEDSRRAARPTLLAFACAMAAFIAWLPALFFQLKGGSEGPSLGIYELGGSPLARAGFFLKNVAGLGAWPFLLPAAAAMLVLLVSAFQWRQRLPAAAESGAGGLPPRRVGALMLLAGLLLAGGLAVAAPRLFPPARQVLLAKGYSPDDVTRELHGFLWFTVSLPAALLAIGLLMLGWRWLSSLPDRLSRTSPGRGRPLAVTVLLAALLLVPLAVALVFAFGGTPLLSDRNLLIFEPPLALALGVGAVGLAKVRWGRLALVPAVLCLALAGFQYQPVSGIFGVRGMPLGMQTGAWRDLAREVNRHGASDPLVLVNHPRSDPAELYLRGHPITRIKGSDRIARTALPGEFRFVHIKGNRSSEALLSGLAGVASLEPELQVDEFVVYDARVR